MAASSRTRVLRTPSRARAASVAAASGESGCVDRISRSAPSRDFAERATASATLPAKLCTATRAATPTAMQRRK
jgi:hypothetical protein